MKKKVKVKQNVLGLMVGTEQSCLICLLLLSGLVMSSLGVVYVKHLYRQQAQYWSFQTQQAEALESTHQQLQAEYSSLTALSQIEWIARKKLGMRMPKQTEISLITTSVY